MTFKEVPAFVGLFRVFLCDTCKCEVKQPLGLAPTPKPRPAQGHEGCAECAFGDVHCTMCDDSLCPEHVRTVERYAAYFSRDLAADLTGRYGGRLFCPLCFQAAVKRFSEEAHNVRPAGPRLFNWPVILGLLSVFVIIMIGLKRCDAASALNEVSVHERRADPEP